MQDSRPAMRENRASTASQVVLREWKAGEDASAFRLLNEEWISLHFVLEAKDREQLGNPTGILAKGGHIFMASCAGEDVGCVALVPMSPGVYEISKMAVAPSFRGQGIGRALLLHAIDYARRVDAHRLVLGSNTRLASAVKLYESAGFLHVPAEKLAELAYNRANVFMELELRQEPG